MRTYSLEEFADIALNLNKHILPDDVLSIYDKLLKDLNINTRVIEHDQREQKERASNKS